MMNEFSGKRILFISPKFFGYEEEIKMKLESLGSVVDFYDERPKNDFLTKALIRVNRNLLARRNANYYNEIIAKTKNRDYDAVFIIRGEVISKNNIRKLKEFHKKAKFILYMWDAFNYSPHSKKIKDMFDLVYTFDREDAQTYSELKFRPLFYIDDYRELAATKRKKDIDVLFVGTVHTDRFTILKKIEEQLIDNGLNYHFYKYYPSKLLFHIKRFFNKDLRMFGEKELQFKGLPKNEVLELFSRAKVIIDIERPKQNGLTIRTIEVFGAKQKLITTNSSIRNYDIYHPENINVIDREHPMISLDFIRNHFKEVPKEIYDKYSIDSWLFEIFEIPHRQMETKQLLLIN
ncbi:hypothetical protein [Bacillus sp. B15-48]|uniref:hypothetical protein n=1 Tax=Bacillus sp. B15-48 TaxID=1548601 RepID=UPI00193F6B20|nr:hypothetical protein [Bacillus sp. B15-48]MBM4764481.1 hypothetical protein [Bacillus sp. B15-48]